jgi:hypothetical protein
MRFSAVMVASDEADPFHLNAGSPSTGSNSVSGEGAIAPRAVTRCQTVWSGDDHGGVRSIL